MHNLEEVLVPIIFFILVFGMFYLYISARNKERLALIEKGADASIFTGGKSTGSGKWILTLGILAVGIALGVIIGTLMESAGMDEEVAYPASIFLFGGGALIAAYFIGKKVNGDKK
ncbi:DUF6249 domain-containing protein [Bacteroidota bacterium]